MGYARTVTEREALEDLPARELHDRATRLAWRRLDVGFLWHLLSTIPEARAAVGDADRSEIDILRPLALLNDLVDADRGDLAEGCGRCTSTTSPSTRSPGTSTRPTARTSAPPAFPRRIPTTDRDLGSYRSEFPVLERKAYLISASLGPVSDRSRRYLDGYLDAWATKGAPTTCGSRTSSPGCAR